MSGVASRPLSRPPEQMLRSLREPARELVVRHVIGLIFDGRLVPGQRIHQDDIAVAVGVSRTPTREAFIGLAQEGLVRSEPRRGFYVAAVDGASVREAYLLSGVVHGYGAACVARQRLPKDLDEVTALASLAGRATGQPKRARTVAHFHAAVLRSSGSGALGLLAASLPRWLDQLSARSPEATEVQVAGIAEICDGIVADRAPAIRERYERLMADVGELVKEAFDRATDRTRAGDIA